MRPQRLWRVRRWLRWLGECGGSSTSVTRWQLRRALLTVGQCGCRAAVSVVPSVPADECRGAAKEAPSTRRVLRWGSSGKLCCECDNAAVELRWALCQAWQPVSAVVRPWRLRRALQSDAAEVPASTAADRSGGQEGATSGELSGKSSWRGWGLTSAAGGGCWQLVRLVPIHFFILHELTPNYASVLFSQYNSTSPVLMNRCESSTSAHASATGEALSFFFGN